MLKENFEALEAIIEAIPDEETLIPNMPIDVFVQEVYDLHEWSQEDQPALVNVGLSQALFDDLPVRAGALRYAQSLWMKERYSKEEAQKEWDQQEPIAEELHDDLEADFRFAFRRRPDMSAKVRAIEEGSGYADLVQDLSDLAVLGNANLPLLESINFDATQLQTASTMSTELATLLAKANGEKIENSGAKQLRDKAYTYCKQAIDEIREAGKYVHRKNDEHLKGYYSRYWRSK